MATVRPFRGLRFTDAAGPLDDLVAPPYDVLSAEQREAYAAKSPHNIVHLTLPESAPDDRSKFVKYARSAARLEAWRREHVLGLEGSPSLYRYSQTFQVEGWPEPLTRTSLIVLLKVEPYANGVVLPHEQTFPKHKEDRLRLLEAVMSHLECIFGLYEDPDRSTHDLVVGSPATELGRTVDADGVDQTLERIDDPAALEAIVRALADKKLWIADGHHRYETALNFRAQKGDTEGEIPEDFMMMAVCSMTDPGLALLPTHRMLKPGTLEGKNLRDLLSVGFDLEETDNAQLMARVTASGTGNFGIALPGGVGLLAKAKNLDAILGEIEGEGSRQLKSLDVSILHRYLFEKLLGLKGVEFFGYTREEAEALASVEQGSPAAFLMNPPTVEDMRLIALGGERMPQKSTYYYPKLLSGLVLWSLKDFGA